jgi:hypothetical protein
MTNPQRPDDHTDYALRRRVNISVGIAAAVLLAILIWTVQWLAENERLQSCYASGRRDCTPLDIPAAPERTVAPTRVN